MFGGAQHDQCIRDAYVLDLATMVSEEQLQVIFRNFFLKSDMSFSKYILGREVDRNLLTHRLDSISSINLAHMKGCTTQLRFFLV